MDNMKLQNLIRMIEKTDCIYCILSHTEPLMKQELLHYLYGLIKNNKDHSFLGVSKKSSFKSNFYFCKVLMERVIFRASDREKGSLYMWCI